MEVRYIYMYEGSDKANSLVRGRRTAAGAEQVGMAVLPKEIQWARLFY
jgi:hypothetical protein